MKYDAYGEGKGIVNVAMFTEDKISYEASASCEMCFAREIARKLAVKYSTRPKKYCSRKIDTI